MYKYVPILWCNICKLKVIYWFNVRLYDFFLQQEISLRIMLVFPRCADCLFIRTALTQQFCPVGGGVCPQRLTPSCGTYAWPQMTATFVTEIITGLNAPFFYCTKSSKSKLLGCFRTILEISSTRTDFRSTLYRKHCSPDQHWLSFSWTAKHLKRDYNCQRIP